MIPLVDSGLIDLLYALGEAAIDQPHPTRMLRKAIAEYERRKEIIFRASQPHANGEADVVETCAAQVIGRRGGKKGGPERARRLTPERRSEIARAAAHTRWNRAVPATASAEVPHGE